ncbi:hypothetical protein ACFO5R_08440 [Halosolutus amylolyticus]|uniref:DUF7344 domain-containing protein n=1 Tax=Halosolutus amylolyticus TaxID=2932267 RepID=A0ABD5PMX6_9EURY|nr:hypothetical protein [Halosolutus amylolyticus]
MADPSSLDTIYGLLAASQRRYILYYLLDNDRANIEGLSLQLAAWENDEPVTAVSEADRKDVVVSLVHSQLPKLESHGVIEYDERSGDIVAVEGFDDLWAAVERAYVFDDAVVIDESDESFLYSEPLQSGGEEQ